MSWPLVIVIVAGLCTFVAALAVVMPYLRVRPQDEVKAAALVDINKRLEALEGEMLSGGRRALPGSMPRRVGG